LLQVAGGGVAVVLLSAWAYRRMLGNSLAQTRGLAPGMPDEVTPNAAFYVVSKNIADPMSDASVMTDPSVAGEDWRLEVGGLVERPLSLSYAELRALPAVEQHYTLCCISNVVGGQLIGNALWRGVPLRTVLDLAGAKPGARKVVFRAADDYSDSVPWDVASRASNLVAWEMNGETLPREHGFPARLLVPNRFGIKNLKWLTRIELVDHDYKGYWQQRFWSDDAVVRTMSRIDVPAKDVLLPAGSVVVGGIAFAGDRGIARVELSADDGVSWQPAALRPALSPYSWVLWTAAWRPSAGRHTLRVRAIDGTGEIQTSAEAGPLPNGATGHHAVVVTVGR
jgi:DMSO/TMAO reductase YedYZ molybdopterin-dependent catalytic subunit